MDNVYVYLTDLPDGIHEVVTPCSDGYTVYIDSALDQEHRVRAYNHAMGHIKENDFEKSDVNQIEYEAHRREIE